MQIHAYRRVEAVSINLFGLDLAFKPNTLGHVVSADVADERVTDRLLSIEEAYVEYTGKGVEAPVAAALLIAPIPEAIESKGNENDVVFDEVLLGSESLPAVITIGDGVTISLGDLVHAAFVRSGLNREEWNLNDQDDREGLLDTEVTLAIVAQEAIVQAAADAATATAAAAADAALPSAPVAETAEPAVPAVNPLVLEASDGEKVDLGAMSESKLRAFALSAGVTTLPAGKGTKVAVLRQMVADALTGVKA